MGLKTKSLCEFKRAVIKNHFDEIRDIVCSPKFVCGKCARVANQSCFLCKAKKLGRN
jgi:hypothetical protein